MHLFENIREFSLEIFFNYCVSFKNRMSSFSDMFTENWDDPNSTYTVSAQPVYEKPSQKKTQKKNKSNIFHLETKKQGSTEENWRSRNSFDRGDIFAPERGQVSITTVNSNTHMKVESSKIGKLIGRQGSKIRELQEITNTRIKIGDHCEEDNYLKEVIIFGKEDCRKECQKLIEELLTNKPLRIEYGPVKERPPAIDWDALNELADKAETEKWANCPPIKKDFYVEDPEVANMSKEEVATFRKEKSNIVVNYAFGGDEKILNPVKTFEQAFRHYPDILREIKNQGFETPSPIQCQAWPILLSGRDLIGIAQTGTGKTIAFLLPALIHIHGQGNPKSRGGSPKALVIAPTRELALQIEKEVQKYSYKGIMSTCVYGGGNRREQVNIVRNGVEIIIATPGRLNDLVSSNVIDLRSITYVVLDEADRMLDMGFEPQIRKVLLDIRPDRQSVMTSATWPSKVQSLAEKYMCNPVQVYIGSLDLTTVHSVAQTVLVVREDEKKDYLLDFIRHLSDDDKVIVFVTRKVVADHLSSDLSLDHILCQCIHGDRTQIDREQALEDLKTGAVKILIATDVASRGIDISDITKVFNYDFPRNIEEYVHRVGRTGRAGKRGEAITLFSSSDSAFAGELITIMEEADQPVPQQLYNLRDRFLNMQQRREKMGPGNGFGGAPRRRERGKFGNEFNRNYS